MVMRLLQIGFFALVALMLVACGTGNDEDAQQSDNQDTDVTEEQNGAAEDEPETGETDQPTNLEESTNGSSEENADGTDNSYNFREFMLEATVDGDDDAIEVDYEIEPNETDASYHDRLNDINLTGEEALQELDSIFSSFTFDENTSSDEVLDEVLAAFNVPENATDIELEIEFNDGTEMEYNR